MSDSPKVVKLAQPGFDVKTASDENLIYNSNWPLLKIYKQDSFRLTESGNTHNTIAEHNLGYPPAFWFFVNSPPDWTATGQTEAERAEYNGIQIGFPVINNNKFIMELNSGFGPPNVVRLYYYIFALDITKAYTSPIFRVGSQPTARSGGKVFKLAKPSKDVDSENLEDFTIHSDCRSPLVHMVYPGVTKTDPTIPATGIGFTVYHNLGYVPMFFAYHNTNDKTPYGATPVTPDSWDLLYPAGANQGFTVDEQKITYADFTVGIQVSLVILKDPFNLDYFVDIAI